MDIQHVLNLFQTLLVQKWSKNFGAVENLYGIFLEGS